MHARDRRHSPERHDALPGRGQRTAPRQQATGSRIYLRRAHEPCMVPGVPVQTGIRVGDGRPTGPSSTEASALRHCRPGARYRRRMGEELINRGKPDAHPVLDRQVL